MFFFSFYRPMAVSIGVAAYIGMPVFTQAVQLASLVHWTGTGTNRAGFVCDWHVDGASFALAWGFRWDGLATSLDMWNALRSPETGLSGMLTNQADRTRLTGVSYTRPRRNGDLLPGPAASHGFRTAYSRDCTGSVFSVSGNWSHWIADGVEQYHPDGLMLATVGMEQRVLTDGSWDAWVFGTGTVVRASGWPLFAIRYPFASAVVDYLPGSGTGYDWLTGDTFTNPDSALGRPSVDTTGDDSMPEDDEVPVVPVYPPWRAHELVSIGDGGRLTLDFGHKVSDHPCNPYGIDFLVFGNAPHRILSGGYWSNGDPNRTVLHNSGGSDPGLISVSQDGSNWFWFSDGPFSDSFMPTLGRVYDPENPDPRLGDANQWWGYPTDPTIPPDPRLHPSDWFEHSVAEVALRYRGSAGGTGFDIGTLPLPVDPDSGLKWIRYVRIERFGSINTEVDAVSAVSPLPPYSLWRMHEFPWMGDPALEHDMADPDDDGVVNLVEYATGRQPLVANTTPVFRVLPVLADGVVSAELTHTQALAAVDVKVLHLFSSSLIAPEWLPIDGETQYGPMLTDEVYRVGKRVVLDGHKGFFRLKVRLQ